MEEVLAKYFSNEATKDEISFVNSWKSESEINAKEFFDAKTVWLASNKLEAPSADLLKKILGEEAKPKQKQVFFSNPLFKYAAAASVLILITLAFFLSGESNSIVSKHLADGSVVSLHDNSTFEVVKMNNNVREIKITGKAYFDIERDENRPFIIHTDNAMVKVLGTSFVVDTYNEKTEVLVESGLVELIKNDSDDVSVKLSEGESGLVKRDNKGIIKGKNENLNYLSWKTKVLTFNNSKMSEVARTLEDVYGISIDIENQDFNDCRLTAKFNKKKPKDALEIIARTFNIEFDFVKGKAVLKGKGC